MATSGHDGDSGAGAGAGAGRGSDDAADPRRPDYGDDPSSDGDAVERVETLIRVLYTLLFFLISQVIEAAIGVIVFFQLVFALITNRTPNPAVNGFARRVIEYGYQIAHYITYNRERPPFPFDELPSETPDERDSFSRS